MIKEGILAVQNFIDKFSSASGAGLSVIALALIIVIGILIIFKFYNSLSKHDIIGLNLSQYNTSKNPEKRKLLAILLYFVEYILIVPLFLFFWFLVLAVLLTLMGSNREISQILLISAAVIAATRILAYHSKDEANELAKLFPLIALSVFLLSAGTFNAERLASQIAEIPALFGNIFYFLVSIFAVEIILRAFYTIMQFWESEDEEVKVKKR